MNLHSRKDFVKASRCYALTFVALTGILVMVLPPNLVLMTAQAQTTQARKAEADRLLDLGIKARRASQYQNAIESALKALAICRELKDRDCEGRAYNGLGLGYYYLGQYDKAIEFQLQRLAIAREIKDRLGEGKALGSLGSAYYFLGKYDKAIEFQLQSLAIAREIKDHRGEGKALENLGNIRPVGKQK